MNDLLREVSRSFYLTLRVLPREIGQPIGLAYLLARATDTVADTAIVPVSERLGSLEGLRQRIVGENNAPLSLTSLSPHQATPGEAKLLNRLPTLLDELNGLPSEDQSYIREVVKIIVSGQRLDLERFGDAHAGRMTALVSAAELEDYTYRVAGCVGEFWTRICAAHRFGIDPATMPALLPNGVRFGQGLQLVNILRDLPTDLRAGRCYLPREELDRVGLSPEDLLDSSNEARLRQVYDPWLRAARKHLHAGWQYTTALKWSCFRVRLACAWPILIGLDTLKKLERRNVLDGSQRIKTTRPEVRRIMVRSALASPWPWAWRRLVKSEVA
jgi:farnesyl-diphosphate farnesyltransferase